ncbi:beta-N-acetylhexosaminidase [soil metagenome]
MMDSSSSLSIRQKLGQMFFIGIAGPEIDDETRELLDEVASGGVCLFARNIKGTEQTRRLLDKVREIAPLTPFLSVDQEGGLVDRLRRIMTPMPAASKLRNADDAAELGSIIGETLRILGFNMNFAPVVDVNNPVRTKYSNGLFSRTFGSSKEEVAVMAGEILRSMQDKGIIGCLKHFPGLAAARVDSHEQLPVVDVRESELDEIDQYPYRQLLGPPGVEAVMVAHATFPHHRLQETDRNGKLLPSSLSYKFVTDLLRGDLRFDGLVITDDLEMGAIVKNYGIGDACKMAIMAGADMLAICADPNAVREGFNAVLAAVESGEIGMERIDESLKRIDSARLKLSEPLEFDSSRLTSLSDDVAVLNERLTQ